MAEELASDGTPYGTIGPVNEVDLDEAPFAVPAVFTPGGELKTLEDAMSPDASFDALDKATHIPDKVVESLLPGFRNLEKRTTALQLFLDTKSFSDIAAELGVPERTVVKWAEIGNWTQFLERQADTMKRNERARLAILRARKREKIVMDQIETGERINENARIHIEEAETASQLKLAAEAAKLGSDMTARALGIGEGGAIDKAANETDGANAPRTLVQVFQGGLPPVRIPGKETIDVGQ